MWHIPPTLELILGLRANNTKMTLDVLRASPPFAPDALGMEMLGTVHNGHFPPTAPWRGLRAAGLHICGEARYLGPPLPCLWKPL